MKELLQFKCDTSDGYYLKNIDGIENCVKDYNTETNTKEIVKYITDKQTEYITEKEPLNLLLVGVIISLVVVAGLLLTKKKRRR